MLNTKETNTSITIKDVAKEAGVAISTVSRVLNNLDRVSDSTRQKVQDAIDKLNFTQNNMAVSIVTGQSKTILILIPDFIYNFYGTVVNGAVNYFKVHGYQSMVICIGDDDLETIENNIKRFVNIIDGALVIASNPNIDYLNSINKPVVLVDRFPKDCMYNTISVDNFNATYQLTQLLIAKGHRNIAIFIGDNNMNVSEDRLQGYIKCLRDHNISFKDENVFRGPMKEKFGYRSCKTVITTKKGVTAIIGCNNKILLGCASALNDLNKTVGKDISLVGFDDSDMAKVYGPGITVAFAPKEKMGLLAAERLLHLIISNEDNLVKHIKINADIRERGSIAKIN